MESIQNTCRRFQVTNFTVASAALALLLSKWMNSSDIIFGVTVSGRTSSIAHSDTAVGLFINTLPVRLQVSPIASIETFLITLQKHFNDMQKRDSISLKTIQSLIGNGDMLFEVLLVFENFGTQWTEGSLPSGAKATHFSWSGSTNYPLCIVITPDHSTWSVHFVRKLLFIEPSLWAYVIFKPNLVINSATK